MHARALKRAAEICGERELAIHLGVTHEQLLVWVRGAAEVPDIVFLLVVDILGEQALRELKNPPAPNVGAHRDSPSS